MAIPDITKSPIHWLLGVTNSTHSSPRTLPPIVVTGDRSDLTALTNLLIALEDIGLIDDQTVA